VTAAWRPTFSQSGSYEIAKASLPFAKICLLNLYLQDTYMFEKADTNTPSHSKGQLEAHN
jgi:hypothetical protein